MLLDTTTISAFFLFLIAAHWTMTTATDELKPYYPIGKPGVPWGEAEKEEWKAQTKKQRSYEDDVLKMLREEVEKNSNDDNPWEVLSYGSLPVDAQRYPLMACKSKNWPKLEDGESATKPCVLVTGGTHGYERSGVHGALLFIKQEMAKPFYTKHFNIVVCPCLSPWAYEHNQRWQSDLQDPNRSFQPDKWLPESEQLREFVKSLSPIKQESANNWICHLDLHETTDTDETEFMPARAAYNGDKTYKSEYIPDGFYLVADEDKPATDFQKAIIENVKKCTHIAPPDPDGKIIDVSLASEGVINVPGTKLGLCMSLTGGEFLTTTEMYPDSKKVTDGMCNKAQVAAIQGALDFIMQNKKML